MKRLFDLVVASVTLLVLSPLLLAVALLIRLGSAGPAFFRQVRVGRNGRYFRLWKFRTMVVDASRSGPILTETDDPRITRIGRILRRYKLDELPQLLNVVAGDMSLVGPRPELPDLVQHYTPEERRVLSVRPGITGPTQLAYRHEEVHYPPGVDVVRYYIDHLMHAKLRSDEQYVAQQALLGDCVLLLRTAWLLLPRRGVPAVPPMTPRLPADPMKGLRMHNAAVLIHPPKPLAIRWTGIQQGLGMGIDAALVGVAYLLAYVIRFEGQIPPQESEVMWQSLALVVAMLVGALAVFGVYRRVWRYAGFTDLGRVVAALTVGTLASGTLILLVGLRGHSRLVFVAFWALAVVLVGLRVGALAFRPRQMHAPHTKGVPSLIVGSGDTAALVINEILRNPALLFRPVGIVSDDALLHGLQIHDVPVVGAVQDLATVVADLKIEQVIIADPQLNGPELKRIIELCTPTLTPVRVFPSPGEVLGGKVEVSRVGRVEVEDLLRRTPVPGDLPLMQKCLSGKRVLITGAGGSIGSELCRQACQWHPAVLVMVDRVENSLYEIDTELSERFPDQLRKAQLADITNAVRMEEVFATYQPDIVFHAAAFKHVPLMEEHAADVVLNNIVGTAHLAQLALKAGVKDFVLISSDKAVDPVNVMGCSKRATELYMQYLAHGPAKAKTKFVAVRFGNVLGSAGSLIPRLRRQIEQGGPVTVTHPQMTRYFMTIPEAVQLVIEAAAMSDGGEIFVLDMGEPVNVVDLVRDLIRLSGLEPGRDIGITYTGLRPGEKLDEELWSTREEPCPTRNSKITAILDAAPADGRDLDMHIDALERLAQQGRIEPMIETLRQVVPEFRPQLLPTGGVVTDPPRRYRILVADDDPVMRRLVSTSLRNEGFDIVAVQDGMQALEQIELHVPDLAILDLEMPNMGGLKLFEKLKQAPETRDMPILLMTAFEELGDDAKHIEYDADDFISKPFRLPEFVVRVKGILRRRYQRPPAAVVTLRPARLTAAT